MRRLRPAGPLSGRGASPPRQPPPRQARAAAEAVGIVAVVLAAGCPARPATRATPPRTRTLLLLTTNDLHGQIAPLRLRSYESPPRTVRVGGAEALLATVSALRSEHPNRVLLVDAGDFMQGSVLSNQLEGRPVRALFRALRLDATVVGNHEFDFGPVGPRSTGGPDPRGALKAWVRGAPFPVLSANLLQRDGRPVRWPGLRPSVLLTRGGLRVGLIGLTTGETRISTHPDNIRDLAFGPYDVAVRREARRLRARGAEVVILVGHVGAACGGRAPETCHGDMVRLLRRLPPGTVDVAVAAHTHKCVWHRIRGVALVQACARGVALGRVRIRVSGGRVAAEPLPPLPVCHDVFSDTGGCEAKLRTGPRRGRVIPNPLLGRYARRIAALRHTLDRFRAQLDPSPDTVVAHAARPIPHFRNRPSPMGFLLAEILRRAVPGAHVALVNAGGVRGGFGPGPIRLRDVHRVFPFDNQIGYADLTGAQIRRLVEGYLGREDAGLLLVAGLRYRVGCGPPYRLQALTDAAGRPLAPTRIYRVALSDFLLSGGDGFDAVLSSVPASRKRVLRGQLVRDALLRALRARKTPLGRPGPQGAAAPLAPFVVVDRSGCTAPHPRPRKAHRLRHICR